MTGDPITISISVLVAFVAYRLGRHNGYAECDRCTKLRADYLYYLTSDELSSELIRTFHAAVTGRISDSEMVDRLSNHYKVERKLRSIRERGLND